MLVINELPPQIDRGLLDLLVKAEPATIGRTQSHGCVRLTNWDALKLAGMVKPGTRVVFSE